MIQENLRSRLDFTAAKPPSDIYILHIILLLSILASYGKMISLTILTSN